MAGRSHGSTPDAPEFGPELQQRGAYFAPRPADDPTATRSGSAASAPRDGPQETVSATPLYRVSRQRAATSTATTWYTDYLALLSAER